MSFTNFVKYCLGASLLLLPSCISADFIKYVQDEQGYHWEAVPSQQPIKNVELHLGLPTLEFLDHCRPSSDACALRSYELNKCYIFSFHQKLSPYMDWHERHHCAGYNHREP